MLLGLAAGVTRVLTEETQPSHLLLRSAAVVVVKSLRLAQAVDRAAVAAHDLIMLAALGLPDKAMREARQRQGRRIAQVVVVVVPGQSAGRALPETSAASVVLASLLPLLDRAWVVPVVVAAAGRQVVARRLTVVVPEMALQALPAAVLSIRGAAAVRQILALADQVAQEL